MPKIIQTNGSPEQTYARQKLAEAITAKGVPTDPKAPFNVMAENVGKIVQEVINFDAEDYSSVICPTNALYDIIKKGMESVRGDYNSLICAEFFKGYETIYLNGADAYLTSDGDFYEESVTHIWHDDDKFLNRYIVYYFKNEMSSFYVANTNMCPRKMFVIGKFDKILFQVVGRLFSIFKTEDSEINEITFADENIFTSDVYIPNTKKLTNGYHLYGETSAISVVDSVQELYGNSAVIYKYSSDTSYGENLSKLLVVSLPSLKRLLSTSCVFGVYMNGAYQTFFKNLTNIIMPELEYVENYIVRSDRTYAQHGSFENLVSIKMPKLKHLGSAFMSWVSGYAEHPFMSNLIDVEVGEMETNLDIRQWKADKVIENLKTAQLNANIRDHIAAKVSDRTGQTALTFTVSANLYANLEQATIDAFTAKNWNVAGA